LAYTRGFQVVLVISERVLFSEYQERCREGYVMNHE
jgi:hypothetical protein